MTKTTSAQSTTTSPDNIADSIPGDVPNQTPDSDQQPPKTAADEIDRIPFPELARFFAAGRCRLLAAEVDFEEAVQAMMDNDSQKIALWIEQDQLLALDDKVAEKWFATAQEVTAAVIAPWVIIHDF